MLGLLFTYAIGAYLNWRLLSIVCSTVPVLTIICLHFLPQSPVFLITKDCMPQAMSSLQFYRGDNVDVSQEFNELEKSVAESKSMRKTGIKKILSSFSYSKPLYLSLMLMMLQQFSGIKVIQSYIFQIFQNAGSKVGFLLWMLSVKHWIMVRMVEWSCLSMNLQSVGE